MHIKPDTNYYVQVWIVVPGSSNNRANTFYRLEINAFFLFLLKNLSTNKKYHKIHKNVHFEH